MRTINSLQKLDKNDKFDSKTNWCKNLTNPQLGLFFSDGNNQLLGERLTV